ncbi:MAG: valine--tRNA ligase [Elusimicrobiota bacterium]|jgi:valyl-tRNA synthetase|nr:valine--tRNA ligase [Elusimicrobiota bacterium]
MDKVYSPQNVEAKWSRFWIENKIFSSHVDKSKKPFTIIIPPPNVTGSLHMGHALNNTLQDVIIRFKKMQGFNALWVPGTDHGGIATQSVVEKLLKKEGIKKHELGREKFLEKMWEWRNKTGDTILEQLKRLGCGLDWDRLAFTMDEKRSEAVKKAFIELFNKGLIYRGKRIVNWCPSCATALADSEVEYKEEKGSLWYIKYPFSDGSGFLVVATTRPETMLGDTAIAVSPDDERYKNFVGKTIDLPLTDRKIKVIKDYAVEKDFATGALKVTPAHSMADDAIAKRNNLDYIEVIDIHGKMINVSAKYEGLTIAQARKVIVEDLEEGGFLEKVEPIMHSVGQCYRCQSVIEPLMSDQWFLNVSGMSKKAIAAAQKEQTIFFPSSWKHPYILWLENIKDWCISRQIWWGHRIPIYYCVDAQGVRKDCPPIAAMEKPNKCPVCGGTLFEQDSDVLDTWFSSALWPLSLFDWGQKENKENQQLNYYYPTSILVTGYEILYLWVARMVQFGLEFMKEVPFKHIFLNGIVRDKHGKKMSKSLGNVVDPIEVMDKFGTDALRFALAQSASPGRDMQISDESFLAARNFANKIWNASRFIIMNAGDELKNLGQNIRPIRLCDKWIVAEFYQMAKNVKGSYEVYEIDVAARQLYDFLWTKFCDWYIELSKGRLASEDAAARKNVLEILVFILKETLKLLSPIMPFITSEIWEILNSHNYSVCISQTDFCANKTPEYADQVLFHMSILQDIIVNIRSLRSQMNVSPAVEVKAIFNVFDKTKQEVVKENADYIKLLAKVSDIQFVKNADRQKNSAMCVAGGFEIFVPLEGLIDIQKEKERLQKEIDFALVEIERTKEKLANKKFLERAPKTEIEKIQSRRKAAQEKIDKINANLAFWE